MNNRWFFEMKLVLEPFYRRELPPVVGYLRGSIAPAVWDDMAGRNQPQMIIIGNEKPVWDSKTGVAGRGNEYAIRLPDLKGYMILEDSFEERPWGVIVPQTADAMQIGFPRSLQKWRMGVIRWRSKYGGARK